MLIENQNNPSSNYLIKRYPKNQQIKLPTEKSLEFKFRDLVFKLEQKYRLTVRN